MVQKAASSSTNIEAEIQGEISGQIIVGNHNVQVHAEHGALVNVISSDKLPVPRARPTPVLSLRPRRFRGLLDRQTEIGSVTAALLSEAPVEIQGEAGIGKTSILRHLAYQPEVDRFSAGVVYTSARRELPGDLLQFLFDAFYESDVPYKPTDTQVRHFLQDKQALVLLDDIELTREAFEGLMDAVPSCAFVVASAERRLWGEARSIAVPGLPGEDALALVEQELGRPLTSDERQDAVALCAAVKNNPLRILQEVSAARDERRSLLAAAQSAQAAPAAEKVTVQAPASLSESQRSILGVLAAFGGASVKGEHLAALSGLPDSEPVVQTLQQRNLIQAEDSRFRLTGNVAVVLNQTWDLTPWRENALTYFTTWAEQHRDLPDSLMEEADCIRELLEWTGETGRWREAQRLGRAMEGALTLSGRWEAWRSVVQSVLQASRALGDQAGAGWAFHQLGTRALCLTEESDARNYLSQAIDIRESLGDRLGAAVSRHNLEILLGPPVPADDPGSSLSGSGSSTQVPLLLKVAGTALLVGLGGVGLWKLMGGSIIPPTELSATLASPSKVALSWSDKSDNETEFRIERRKGDGIFVEVARRPPNSTRLEDADLDPNTSYTYRLRAASPDGESAYSNESSVLTLPAPPSALSLRAVSPIELELGWTDNSPNPSDFRVERSSGGGETGTYSVLARVPAGTTTYSETAITADANFYYRVRGTNASGDSEPSNVQFWSLLKEKPVAPTLNKAEPASSTQVNLQWTDGSNNETGFKIERRVGTGSFSQIEFVEANKTTYEDRGLTADTSYSYRMRATNGAGDSSYTREVHATTSPEPPRPPSDLTLTSRTSGSVDLAWRDNSANETGFNIERRMNGSYQRIKTMAAGAVKFADSGLNPQTNYAYRVQAFNRAGGSAFSNEVSITIPALPGRIEVSLTPMRFGPVTVGSTVTAQYRITNIGTGALEVSAVTASAPFKALFPQEGRSLGPDRGSLQVKLEFAPTEPGDFTGVLTIKSSDPRRPEVQVELNGTGKRDRVPVQLVGVKLAVTEVVGGESSNGTVTLNGAAPEGGAAIALSCTSQVVEVPSSVVVRGGETNAVFTFKTEKVARNTRATIWASMGADRIPAVLGLKPGRAPQQPEVKLESLTLASSVLTGGESSDGKVTLNRGAPEGGAAISLSTSSDAVGVPSSVMVRGGETNAGFRFRTSRVAKNTRATIWASLGADRIPAVLELRPGRAPQEPEVRLESLTLSSSVLTGGEASDGKVTLNRAAPEGGAAINLTTSSDAVVVPTDLLVRGGETSAVFRFRTVKVAGNTRVTIWASLGQVRRPAVLELRPGREPTRPEVRLESLTLQPIRVKGGQRSVGTVTLSGKAPRDTRVAIVHNKPGVVSTPGSVTVKVGSAVATFSITTEDRADSVIGGVAGKRRPPQSEEVQVTIAASLDGKSSTKILTVW